MILLYGMPSLIAQGLLLVGFIYLMAYVIKFLENLFKKPRKHVQSTEQPIVNNNIQASDAPKNVIKVKPQYKIILNIKSDLAKLENSQYVFFAVQSLKVGDLEVPFKEICDSEAIIIKEFGQIEECIDSYWIVTIEDSDFDKNKLEFICISKNDDCNELSIYSASEVLYDGNKYKMQRIENLNHLEGVKSSVAFDNWVNRSGLNNKSIVHRRML